MIAGHVYVSLMLAVDPESCDVEGTSWRGSLEYFWDRRLLWQCRMGLCRKSSVCVHCFNVYTASICAGAPVVLAEPHYSPHKAQAAAMASVLAAQAAVAAGGAACTSGATATVETLRAASIDMAFWAFLAASAAGVVARGFTQHLRDRHTSGVEEEAEHLNAAYMRDGMSPDTVEEPHDLRVRADAEWLRWLEADKWSWQPARRRDLAERLFAEQAVRRCAV